MGRATDLSPSSSSITVSSVQDNLRIDHTGSIPPWSADVKEPSLKPTHRSPGTDVDLEKGVLLLLPTVG